ncbi:hypothetical protein PAPHI01_0677 [Pancytospora philotis]|nr:hypothetical protein PAPHI01_0677 [Pancytospora philotis]
MLANKLGQEMQCKPKTISYVMTWDGVVTKYHRKYSKEIGLTDSIEAYIQTIVLKKTLESISFDYRRGLEPEDASEERAGALNGTDSKGAGCLAAATQ